MRKLSKPADQLEFERIKRIKKDQKGSKGSKGSKGASGKLLDLEIDVPTLGELCGFKLRYFYGNWTVIW